jgi:cytoskeletal protein CcmA (bactofilin family)
MASASRNGSLSSAEPQPLHRRECAGAAQSGRDDLCWALAKNALDVGGRVQYTVFMLWRTKKNSAEDLSVSSSVVTPVPVPGRNMDEPANRDVIIGSESAIESKTAPITGSYKIPKGYRVSGAVVTARPVVIEGELAGGSLVAPSVVVGKGAVLAATTKSPVVDIAGFVNASLFAREGVIIRSGGEVRGDLNAASLTVAPGGVVAGARLAIGPLRGGV